jgi:hypothetical protein
MKYSGYLSATGEHGRRDPQLKTLATLSETALHAATAEQHRDAPLDVCAKALAVLELPALLIGFALGALWHRRAVGCTPP